MLKMPNKKAMMWGPRKIGSIILGLIVLILGAVPLLNSMKVIPFGLPAMPAMLMWIVAIAGGIWLLVDGFAGGMMGVMHIGHWLLIIAGIAFLVLGGIPLAFQLKWIGFTLPVFAQIVTSVIYTAGGVLLIGGTWAAM